MMTITVEMKSYIGRESGHDGDQGVTAGISKCRRPSRYVPYKGTFVPYNGTYGVPDQGQTLDV